MPAAGVASLATTAREDLPPPTPEERALISRTAARRLALQQDNQTLRARYEEVMRWINPPWDTVGRRPDPWGGERATTDRQGRNMFHADLVSQVVDRWAALQMAESPVLRVMPHYVPPPVENPDDAQETLYNRKQYEIDRAIAQGQSSQMEAQTQEWAEAADLHRTLFWAVWAAEAFGKSIVKSGWDPDAKRPTAELYENPSTCYYGWSKRYGTRKLSWCIVADEMSPEEANARFGLHMPLDNAGALEVAQWTGLIDTGDMDQRDEQQAENQRYVWVEEVWELDDNGDARYAMLVAGRVIEQVTYPWKKLPFHVIEPRHIPTWSHGKSVAEVAIPINESLDQMWDRQREVIDFEAGPRFKGMGLANSGDDVDVPGAFEMIPLREGEDIVQLDTRVDFFPTELHAQQMLEAIHRATGLTPIAWGMSPNAQTSGRAMSAEWRAVELPLASRLINMGPTIKEIYSCWWDYAEAYVSTVKAVGKGDRRFQIVWVPIDIRDKTEKTNDIIARKNADMIDPETAIEESGYENSDEIAARVRAALMDPVWNPLRYQQYLTLQQLELTIRQTQLQVSAMEQQAGQAQQAGAPPGAGPSPDQLAQQGANAAGQAAQNGPTPTVDQNQPGQTPPTGAGGLPINTSILSQTPLVGGIGNRAIVNPAGGPAPSSPGTGPAPSGGQIPR